jgi:putative heme-binding domain-containing protein
MTALSRWRVVLACLLLSSPAPAADLGLRLPPGFEATEYADGTLAPDIHCMTLDPQGRVVVSGRGYVRVLVEGPAGRAERALDFAAAPRDGAMGLFWEGDSLYCVGDGGLRVYRDAAGAGRRKPSKLLFACRTGSEHGAHAVARGPDGWLYLLAGNNTGIRAKHATLPTSPVKDPVAGCVLRFPRDFSGSEIVADGFRNAYGMDFGPGGELFTFDSDNERCVSLPWYEPTRCYHVQPGGHHGWRNPQHAAFWRYPPYFLDCVAPVCTLGRGSPTGVVCYKHTQFPPRYRGGLFLLDWTFGVVHYVTLHKEGSTYRGTSEVFLRSVGDNGFAPTAAAVHPLTGDLFVSIGGRGTRGAVYRIRYTAGMKGKPAPAARPTPRSLDWRPGLDAALARDAAGADLHARRRALDLILRHRSHFRPEQLASAVRANAGQADRGLRQAAARLLAALPAAGQNRLAKVLVTPLEKTTLYLARPSLDAAELLKDPKLPAAVRLDAVRLVQLALGNVTAKKARGTVFEGYTRQDASAAVPAEVKAVLRTALPASPADLQAELARTLALVEDDNPQTLRKVARLLGGDTDPIDETHYLIVLARLTAPRPTEVTRKTADALLSLDRKLTQRGLNRDTNWPLRLAELHAALAARDPSLNAALVGDSQFGRPDHAVFTRAKGFDRRRAAAIFLARAEKDSDYPWNAELVRLVAQLPAGKALPALRKLYGEQGLDEVILPVLARTPLPADRDKYLAGLASARLDVVQVSLSALDKLPAPAGKDPVRDEAFALVRAQQQAGAGKDAGPLRRSLAARLEKVTGQKHTTPEAWRAWLGQSWPELGKRLTDADGVDVPAWQKRLARLDWSAGEARKGEAVYLKASCASCHSGAAALGPDLRGVTKRFSRDDLFTAILRPSKDVAPRYRTTQLTTLAGKVYQGIVAYEAADGVLLLTGPGQNVRIGHKQVSERRLTARSLMPAGLLDRLSDAEVAHLYAYLRSLAGKE